MDSWLPCPAIPSFGKLYPLLAKEFTPENMAPVAYGLRVLFFWERLSTKSYIAPLRRIFLSVSTNMRISSSVLFATDPNTNSKQDLLPMEIENYLRSSMRDIRKKDHSGRPESIIKRCGVKERSINPS
jgi:hypothetical protein